MKAPYSEDMDVQERIAILLFLPKVALQLWLSIHTHVEMVYFLQVDAVVEYVLKVLNEILIVKYEVNFDVVENGMAV